MKKSSALFWVPTLYFAEGLPYALVTFLPVVLFSNLKFDPAILLFWTGLLALPWTIRPLWAPVVERYSNLKRWICRLEPLSGLLFAGFGLLVGLYGKDAFAYGMICLFAAAFLVATHDVAVDGFYLEALDKHSQAWFSGWRNAAYKFATITGQGAAGMAAGWLCRHLPPERSWCIVYIMAAVLMIILGIWHSIVLPNASAKENEKKTTGGGFYAAYLEFIKFPEFGRALAFFLLFRLAESQLRVAVPFMLEKRALGGLEMTVEFQGFLYGTCGVAALLLGGVLSGVLVAKHGIKRWIWWLVLALNLPDFAYIYFAFAQPLSPWPVALGVLLEQFGYGFGLTLSVIYMFYVAEHATGHRSSFYALMTGLTFIGLMIPGSLSGYILQLPSRCFGLPEIWNYRIFFIWVAVCTLPSYLVTWLISCSKFAGFECSGK